MKHVTQFNTFMNNNSHLLPHLCPQLPSARSSKLAGLLVRALHLLRLPLLARRDVRIQRAAGPVAVVVAALVGVHVL